MTTRPNSGQAQEQLGQRLAAQGDRRAALEAFRRAVQLNDAQPASWAALQSLCRSFGLNDEADEAARAAGRLASLPPALAEGSFLMNEGELGPA
jgi:tetratricopeptide (TPR) repeat protein